MRKFAVIFDMDGTLIDNNAYHFKSWQVLFKNHDKPELTQQVFNERISGVPGKVTLKEFINPDLTEEELDELMKEKDAIYKSEYQPHIAPINGLERLLTELKGGGIKMAVASSAAPDNIRFIFDKTPFDQYFDVVIDGTRLSKSKPDPQIFLKAAKDLGMDPADCIVFEDSLAGIKAANSAGMKVIGITTTHQPDELRPVEMAINDYAGITLNKLAALFEDTKHER
jgi:beta-phosphoglucomutase